LLLTADDILYRVHSYYRCLVYSHS